MTVTGTQIVDRAKSKVGQHEVPMGSNTGPFVLACQHSTFLGGTGWPWCAAFVCWVSKSCGVPLAYNGAGAHDIADHHKPWVAPEHVKPGMVVDYNIGSGHTGIVAHIEVANGRLTSIDGNWSDSVTEHQMALSEVRAFWRIPGVTYGTTPTPAPTPVAPSKWVWTTSANGHTRVFRRKRGLLHYLQTHVFPNGITIRKRKA